MVSLSKIVDLLDFKVLERYWAVAFLRVQLVSVLKILTTDPTNLLIVVLK